MAKENPLMDAVWRATVACSLSLASDGFSTAQIAAQMPDAMKTLANSILRKQGNLPYLLDGGAEVMGIDHARRIIAARAAT